MIYRGAKKIGNVYCLVSVYLQKDGTMEFSVHVPESCSIVSITMRHEELVRDAREVAIVLINRLTWTPSGLQFTNKILPS